MPNYEILLYFLDKSLKEYIIIDRYLTFLYSKYDSNKISFRTIRLSLTPAIKLLTYRRE